MTFPDPLEGDANQRVRSRAGPDSAEDRTIIIGAGPAGLTAAYELGRLGLPGVVLEKSDLVGGLSCTVIHNGYRFDIGGHRFFTKVPMIAELWRELLGDDLLECPRMSRIYYQGKFFDYPLRPVNALSKLGPVEAIRIVVSYLYTQSFPLSEERSFEDWVVNRFGRRLYEIFFKSYTEKVWGIPCSEIGSEWAAQRIKNLNLGAAIKNSLLGVGSRKRKVITTLIDRFEYPRLGPGMMWERCRDRVAEMGVATVTKREVTRILHHDSEIVAVVVDSEDGERELRGANFISSMPIRRLVNGLDPAPPDDVVRAANKLRYRDFLAVALIIDRAELFPDNWIYIHSSSVRVGRVQNFKNWSPQMVADQSKTSLVLEYFVQEGDDLWSSSDEDLRDLAVRELEELGLAESDEVLDYSVVRVQKAYPVYDSHYAERLKQIRAYLSRFRNLQLVGRNGQHRYNNQDHSMMTGILAARNVAGEEHDIWAVNVEDDYLEAAAREVKRPADRLVPERSGEERPLQELLGAVFARYDPVALGGAIGLVAGLGLFLATAVLLIRGDEPVGPTLSLLGNYFLGFEASWSGAVLGLVEAGLGGFVFGYTLATLINFLVDIMATSVTRECQLKGLLDPLEVVEARKE